MGPCMINIAVFKLYVAIHSVDSLSYCVLYIICVINLNISNSLLQMMGNGSQS